jgi:hypothetical protein
MCPFRFPTNVSPQVAAFGPTQFRKPLREAGEIAFASGSAWFHPISAPTRRICSFCCAPDTTGHAAALPIPATNSRRRISALQRFVGEPAAVQVPWERLSAVHIAFVQR